jgi:hypothetical protein
MKFWVFSIWPITLCRKPAGKLRSVYIKVKGKQSHYRPGQALRFPGGWGSQIAWQSAHEGGKIVSSMHWVNPQEIFLVLISIRDWVDPRAIVRPEGLCHWKIPMTLLGIELVTFWLVVQCLNQLRHRMPRLVYVRVWIVHMGLESSCLGESV